MIKIIRDKSRIEKLIDENCFITEIINTSEFDSFSLSKAKVLPGITTELHQVKSTTEVYYILSGTGEMEIDGEITGIVSINDVVFIPENSTQRIKNIGEDDLIFLCICSPRFLPENYVQH